MPHQARKKKLIREYSIGGTHPHGRSFNSDLISIRMQFDEAPLRRSFGGGGGGGGDDDGGGGGTPPSRGSSELLEEYHRGCRDCNVTGGSIATGSTRSQGDAPGGGKEEEDKGNRSSEVLRSS